MRRSYYTPTSFCSDAEVASAERICDVGFARYSVEYLVEL